MGLQTAALEQEETAGEQDSAIESDMLSSFADSDAPEPLTTAPTETGEKLANPDEQATPDVDETPGEREPDQASASTGGVDELAAALSRLSQLETVSKHSADNLAGRLGSMEHIVKLLQSQTKTGQPVRLKMEDFDPVFADEYPIFAEAQVQAMNKVLGKLQVTGLSEEFTTGLVQQTATAAETAAEKRTARIRSDACREDLDETHPGWREIVGLADKDVDAGGVVPDTEYRRWLTTQPSAYQDRVGNTYSAVVMGRSLDAFNTWKKAQARPRTIDKPVPATRQQRLSSTVVPKASGSHPRSEKVLTEDEAMMAAFQGTI
jgi:hypothetical protein